VWQRAHKFHSVGAAIADRHYSRQTPGSPQFVPPGLDVVLLAEDSTSDAGALWVSSWPEYVQHRWPGSWMCTTFRNELPGRYLSSDLVRQAVAVTRYVWGDPPAAGMVTFVHPDKVRHKRDPGRCFRRAGFEPDGYTLGGLLALRLPPASVPEPLMPSFGDQLDLWADLLDEGVAS
jgi:hypothetical protein